jgi:hypothetical protein
LSLSINKYQLQKLLTVLEEEGVELVMDLQEWGEFWSQEGHTTIIGVINGKKFRIPAQEYAEVYYSEWKEY